MITNSLNRDDAEYQFILYGYAGQTGTTLAASPTSVTTGQPITFTATVSAQDGGSRSSRPGGGGFRRREHDDWAGLRLCPNASSSFSFATFTTSSLPVGQHAIMAVYEGTDTAATSTSDPQNVVVTGGTASMTTLSVSAASISAGGSETLMATISGVMGTQVNGTVAFFDQNGMLGTGDVMSVFSGGTASLTSDYAFRRESLHLRCL